MILALLLSLALDGPAPIAPANAKPVLRLTVRPDVQLWRGQAAYVAVIVRLEDPHRELGCPELKLEWGDGSRSGWQAQPAAGCDPFGLGMPTLYRWTPKMHAYREPSPEEGFIVTACVVDVLGRCRGNLTVRRLVHVRGPGQLPELERKWARR